MTEDFAVSGVYAAVLTALRDDLSIDIARTARHCDWLLANGCDGLGVLGTTGEANAFTLKERLEMLDGLAEAGVPTAPMMPGTGCCAIGDTVELTKKAVEIGAGSVLMLPPFYYKNCSDDGLYAAFSEVIQRVGSSDLKVLLYHFPQMSMVPLSIDLMARLVRDYPGAVVGVKDSSGVLENMTAVAREIPGFAVMSGADDVMLPLLKEGGAGCITACSNIASPVAREVYAAARRGDWAAAEAIQPQLRAIRELTQKFPLFSCLKALMRRHTGEALWDNIRPPLTAMSDADKARLYAGYDATGLTMAAV